MTELNTKISVPAVQNPENRQNSKKKYHVIPNDLRKRFIERVSANKVTIKQVKPFFSVH